MSETHTSEVEEINKDPNNVYVFISYSHDDLEIARCLHDELNNINPDRVRCFLDAYSIRSGEQWDLKIIAQLKVADWLIFLYTGRERRSYDYCGFEIGIFTSVHDLNTPRKITESARLVCLHDTKDVPSLLSMVQNRYIRPFQAEEPDGTSKEKEFYTDSPLAQFFEDFYQFPPGRPLRHDMLMRAPEGGSRLREMPNIASEIVQRVKNLTMKFQEARRNDPVSEKFYQVRMEIDVRDATAQVKTEIPGWSTVTAMQDMFNLIGLSPDPNQNGDFKTTWGEMRSILVSNNETSTWMDKVEDDILDAVHQRNLGSPEICFRAHDGQFYRPLLARQIIYGNGARTFSVIFVRTLPRKFVGDETTSALLIGLILASRFRFVFIESGRELLEKTLRDGMTDAEFQLACRQLLYDIERMEQESSEFGMNSPELLLHIFGPNNHEVVKAFYEIWLSARNTLFAVLKARLAAPSTVSRASVRQEVKKFADAVDPYNRRFLEMCLQKYTRYLGEWLKRGTRAKKSPRSVTTSEKQATKKLRDVIDNQKEYK
jgi:hypothetical protein